jgi:hypothetical protein
MIQKESIHLLCQLSYCMHIEIIVGMQAGLEPTLNDPTKYLFFTTPVMIYKDQW